MTRTIRSGVLVVVLILVLASTATMARAQWEVEADPVAYGLSGFSLHLARQALDGAGRVQVGIFGAEVPERFHGNDGFTVRTRGVTAKADYFLRGQPAGLFLGVDGNYSRVRYHLDTTGGRTTRNLFALGPRVGYRFNFGERVYLTPWVSTSYVFNTEDVIIDGERFEERPYRIFPAVHVGWRF